MKYIYALLALCLMLTLSSCMRDFPVNRSGDQCSQNFKWSYLGKQYDMTYFVQALVFDHYHGLPKQIPYQCFAEEDYYYPYMFDLAHYFERIAREEHFSRKQTAEFVLSFCQSIPYYDDPYASYDWIRWPCETLMEKRQDCEDISILYVAILSHMNFKTCLVMMPDAHHMAAGVEVQGNSGYYYSGRMGRYSFAECTHTGWALGRLSVAQDSAIIFEIMPANPLKYTKVKRHSKTLSQSGLNREL